MSQAKPPECKFGPYAGGVGVAIWLNTAETDEGERQFRSITISPRRYQDSSSGKWKDAKSFQVSDIPTLIHALQKAQAFILETPLRNEAKPSEVPTEDIPF